MVKVPTYVRTHIPQAVGTPGVDPTAGAIANIVGQTADFLVDNYRKQKKIADGATASKLAREADIEYAQKLGEVKAQYQDDPARLTEETQKLGDEIYGSRAADISSPEVRNSYLERANRQITSTTLSTIKWSSDQQANRARSDFDKARTGAVASIGASFSASDFNTNAITYAQENKELYSSIYGKEGVNKLKKDLADGAERYMQDTISADPFRALQDIESGKLDKYLSADQISKWKNRSRSAIKNYKKNLVTKTKSTAVVSGSALGNKIVTGEAKAADIEKEYNRVKDREEIPEQYKTGLKLMMDMAYKGETPSLVTQLDNYDEFNQQLTLVAEAASGDPDKFFDSVLDLKGKVAEAYEKKQLSNAGFKDLYADALSLVEDTAKDLNAKIGEGLFGRGGIVQENTARAYKTIDAFLETDVNKAIVDQFPKGFASKLKVDMKIDYNQLVLEGRTRLNRELTTAEYKRVLEKVIANGINAISESPMARGVR